MGVFGPGGAIDAPESTRLGLEQYNAANPGYPDKYHYSEGLLSNPAHGAVLNNQVYLAGRVEAQRFGDWGANPDASCLANNPKWVCLDSMHVLSAHLETPVFVAAQSSDHVVLRAFTTYALAPGGSTEPGGIQIAYHPNDHAARVRTMVRRLDDLNAGHGAFITPTDDHMSLTKDRKVAREIGGVSLAQALYLWAVAPPGAESFCVSNRPPGPQHWYHVEKDGPGNDYRDDGADPTFACPGASF